MYAILDRRFSPSDISYIVKRPHQIGYTSCYRKQREQYLHVDKQQRHDKNQEKHSRTVQVTIQNNKAQLITKLRRIA